MESRERYPVLLFEFNLRESQPEDGKYRNMMCVTNSGE